MTAASGNDPKRMREVIERLRASERVLALSHKRPDGDAIGSGLALVRWLRSRGVPAEFLLEDGVPPNYRFIRAAREVLTTPPEDLAATTLVVLDTTDVSRAGECASALGAVRETVSIDHHPDNRMFADVNLVDPSASAAALLVQELIEMDGAEFDVETASLLYVGIVADTGAFRHSNVDARTMAAAARLVAAGANAHELTRNVFAEQPLSQVRLLGMMLSSMEIHLGGRLALSFITDAMRSEAGVCSESMEGLATYGRLIEGVEVAALIREIEGGVRVSLRSNGSADVQAIAARLGGGGHRAAAGVVLNATMDDGRRMVQEAVREYFEAA